MDVSTAMQTAPLNDKIVKAQIKECCRPHIEIFVAAALTIAFTVFICFDTSNKILVFTWAGVAFSILGLRYLFISWFNRIPETDIALIHIRAFSLIMIVWGAGWGIATLLFFPDLSVPKQAAWFAMFMVMVSASASSHAVYLKVFYAFSLPYFVCVVWVVAEAYPSDFHINALAVCLVMITQVGAAKKGNQVILKSLRLRYQNLALIEQLKIQKEAAEQADLSKSKFLAAASHDLRQPLHALSLFSAALDDALDDKEKAKKLTKQINQSVMALQELLDALLDISRLDAGSLTPQKMNFSAQELFDKLRNEFMPLAREKKLSMRWETVSANFYTDPTLLALILRNLLSNAIRYTKEGEIAISLVQEQDAYWIAVKDTGIGIPLADQSRIFNEFIQLHNPERDRNKGLGLGLSIVIRVAKLIGSEIRVESKENIGSTFSLRVTKAQTATHALSDSYNTHTNEHRLGTVLIIDDEQSILEGMQALLQGWGYQTLLAREQAEALRKIEDENICPDCIIADYRLKNERNGLSAMTSSCRSVNLTRRFLSCLRSLSIMS
ncbi:hybrid sensor histidine kinase/response regulator [Agaribacter flavus]|uniref:histidine kinase n=1 Tax=Agaribacter flavus TaxID=1902781 RepID=A0ABV7FJK9_9ALTE